MCVCTGKTDTLGMQCYGMIGTFSKGELRVLGNSKDFVRVEIEESNSNTISEEIKQAIENNEAIAVTDDS